MEPFHYKQEILHLCENRHLSVLDLMKILSKSDKKIALSSIYRNVEHLVEEGQLTKVQGSARKAYFEKTKAPHMHLIDREKGIIMDLEIPESLRVENQKYEGFEAQEVDLKIFGSFKSPHTSKK